MSRRSILNFFYPALIKLAGIFKFKNSVLKSNKKPFSSFYDLSCTLNDGSVMNFSLLKGKFVLIVNTASDCGFTRQYEDLEKFYMANKDILKIIAFPSNDFKEQEKGTDEEIRTFCQKHFDISFPLAKKSVVVKSTLQNEVFKWLSSSKLNGWNNVAPTWNFCKYLIDKNGNLEAFYESAVPPMAIKL